MNAPAPQQLGMTMLRTVASWRSPASPRVSGQPDVTVLHGTDISCVFAAAGTVRLKFSTGRRRAVANSVALQLATSPRHIHMRTVA